MGKDLLRRKWTTIMKLQQQILNLEREISEQKSILSKNVRKLTKKNTKVGHPALKRHKQYQNHRDRINSVALHQKEPVFASASSDFTIRIYDYELQE